MVLKHGEKVHVIKRRVFVGDIRRHFIGEVIDTTESAVRLEGHAFVLDTGINQYVRRPEVRTRIVSLVDANIIINVLPPNAKIDKAVYTMGKDGRLCVTDGETFTLDINEFGFKT